MAYQGNSPALNYISFAKQTFSIVNGQTSYTLNNSVANGLEILLYINNVKQVEGSGNAYTASGNTLTIASALTSGSDEMYCLFIGKAVQSVVPPSGSVTNAMLGETITVAKGGTGLTSGFANGITMADHWRLSANTNSGTSADITTNWERVDLFFEKIGTGMTESSGIFSFPSTGKYLITEFWTTNVANGDLADVIGKVTTDNSTYAFITRNLVTAAGGAEFNSTSNQYLLDVTDTSNVKIKWTTNSFASGTVLQGSTDDNRSSVSFLRIGDT